MCIQVCVVCVHLYACMMRAYFFKCAWMHGPQLEEMGNNDVIKRGGQRNGRPLQIEVFLLLGLQDVQWRGRNATGWRGTESNGVASYRRNRGSEGRKEKRW